MGVVVSTPVSVLFLAFSCALRLHRTEFGAGNKGKFNKRKGKDAFKGSKGRPDKPFGKGLCDWSVFVLGWSRYEQESRW